MEANIQVGLQTKPNRTDVILVDGSTHMTGDLDLRGNKLIFPSEIDMDRKLQLNPAISKSQGKWKKVRNSGVSK